MHIPLYADAQLSGGECTARDFAEYLNNLEGYSVRVLVAKAVKSSLGAVPIYVEDKENKEVMHLYKWANIVYTHLGMQGRAANLARTCKKPLVLYMHNTNGSAIARSRKEIAVVYNSYFTKERVGKDFEGNKSMLLRPILKLKEGNSTGEYVTMINLNENKGGLILKQVAEAMPHIKFLAVTGGYGKQFTKQPDNVTVLPPQDNMDEVYSKTKLLIMPSTYESYGRTAAEAIGYKIPVLYSNTDTALEEVVGNAGEPVNDREKIEAWMRGVTWISGNIDHYKERTVRQCDYLQRQITLDGNNFTNFLKNLTFE